MSANKCDKKDGTPMPEWVPTTRLLQYQWQDNGRVVNLQPDDDSVLVTIVDYPDGVRLDTRIPLEVLEAMCLELRKHRP